MSRINKSIFILFCYKRRNCNICIGFDCFVDAGCVNIKVQRVWERQKQQVNLTWNPVATYHNNDCCSLALLGSKVTPCQPTADAWALWAKRVKFSSTCAEIRSSWLKKSGWCNLWWISSAQRQELWELLEPVTSMRTENDCQLSNTTVCTLC